MPFSSTSTTISSTGTVIILLVPLLLLLMQLLLTITTTSIIVFPHERYKLVRGMGSEKSQQSKAEEEVACASLSGLSSSRAEFEARAKR